MLAEMNADPYNHSARKESLSEVRESFQSWRLRVGWELDMSVSKECTLGIFDLLAVSYSSLAIPWDGILGEMAYRYPFLSRLLALSPQVKPDLIF